jgi:hypothetical protein
MVTFESKQITCTYGDLGARTGSCVAKWNRSQPRRESMVAKAVLQPLTFAPLIAQFLAPILAGSRSRHKHTQLDHNDRSRARQHRPSAVHGR